MQEYKQLKNLKKENLRDHMNDLELIFSMLGEKATTEITKAVNSNGLEECKDSAQKGGKIAGDARFALEQQTKQNVVTSENYLEEPEKVKRKKLK